GYRRVLGIFIGEDVISEVLIMPDSTMPLSDNSKRPELKLFDKQVAANNAADIMANVSLMPRIGLFAQAYYNYPGLDYFKSMMERNLSFNILAGVKVSWNIDSFYTRKNTRRRTSVNNAGIATDRDLFLFNNRLQAISQMVSINGMQSIIMDDARIVELRKNVRKAAESQLDNGVIDATALLTKITDENVARLTSRYHDIQLRQEIYKLKYILNQ
uniref:TolC family protein n=1 Tax=Xylanibacter rodentium TaxID=2736289 RepID=UPI002574C2D2